MVWIFNYFSYFFKLYGETQRKRAISWVTFLDNLSCIKCLIAIKGL